MQTANRNSIDRLLNAEKKAIMQAYFRFVHQARSPAITTRVLNRAAQHDFRGAVNALQGPLKEFARAISESFIRAGHREARQIASKLKIKKFTPRMIKQVGSDFDPGDPIAAGIMDDSELEFITGFTNSQRDAVRTALSESLKRGDSPIRAARSFRDSIGLTENQVKSVSNYRNLLERGSSEVLNRTLRDARSDRTVQGALSRGDILDANTIDRMVSRYADNMVTWRAETIARTESLRAVSAGRQQSLKQMSAKYDISHDDIVRTWNATMDERTRDTHAEMDGQQVSGMRPFKSPSGAVIQYPGDPMAPPEESINCRCVETYDIASE